MMITNLTVKRLKEFGYVVTVTHSRYFRGVWQEEGEFSQIRSGLRLMTFRDARLDLNSLDMKVELLPKGGETMVTVFDPHSGKKFRGVAKCHPKDNFNKQEGVRIALARIADAMLASPDYTPLCVVKMFKTPEPERINLKGFDTNPKKTSRTVAWSSWFQDGSNI